MANSDQEIEIKLNIPSVGEVIDILKAAGAQDLGWVEQVDSLWDRKGGPSLGNFDQAIRVRIEKTASETKTTFTFKGTPHLDEKGMKTRDEFNTTVDNPEALGKILSSIGFFEDIRIEKKRYNFKLNNLDIAIDEAKFGNFLELEGEKDEIEKTIKELNLSKYPTETRPYFKIQQEWEEKNK